jgi:hypothetical protein
MMISGSEWSAIENYNFTKLPYQRRFTFPLQINTDFAEDLTSKGFSIDAKMDFSKHERVLGSSVFTPPTDAFESDGPFDGWSINNRQNGSARYFTDGKKSGSSGATEQDLVLKGIKTRGESHMEGIELYSRHVLAVNNSVVSDSQSPGRDANVMSGTGFWEFAPVSREAVRGAKVFKGEDAL